MARRGSMSRHRSKKMFKRGAKRVHSKNLISTMFMRGGIRL